MRIIFCFLKKDLEVEREKWLLSFDDANTEIHLYENTLQLNQNAGYLLQEYDVQIPEDCQEILLLTDRIELGKAVQEIYTQLFDQVIVFPLSENPSTAIYDDGDTGLLGDIVHLVHRIKTECYAQHCESNPSLALNLQNELCQYADLIAEKIPMLSKDGKKYISGLLMEYIQDSCEENRTFRVYVCGVLLKFFPTDGAVTILLREIVQPYYSVQNWYFIHQFLGRHFFLHPQAGVQEHYMLYEQILKVWRTKLASLLIPIPRECRNHNRVVVMTVQFLSEIHAPTHSAEERIYTLGKNMGMSDGELQSGATAN